MKAIQFTQHGDPSVFEYVSIDTPTPARGEVGIDVAAVGVNFADLKRRAGSSSSTVSFPYIPGIEAAGTVVETNETPGINEGDRVAVYVPSGAYAETIVTAAQNVYPIPDSLSFDVAASIFVQFITAYQSLHDRGEITPTDRVLIHAAAGGVGSAAVQLASNTGAEIFATASTAEKLRFAESLGATHLSNYATNDFVSDIRTVLDNETGIDVVLDGVGGPVIADNLRLLSPNGRYVTIGAASGSNTGPDPSIIRRKNIRLHGYHLRTTLNTDPQRVSDVANTIFEDVHSNSLSVHIDKRFQLSDAKHAHEYINNRENIGKILLLP